MDAAAARQRTRGGGASSSRALRSTTWALSAAAVLLALLPAHAAFVGAGPRGSRSSSSSRGGWGRLPLPQLNGAAAVAAAGSGGVTAPPMQPMRARPSSSRVVMAAGAAAVEEEQGVGVGAKKPVRDILCLDFDGVICNSVGESSQAAYRSVRKLWPQLATFCTPLASANTAPGAVPEIPSWLADSLRQLRPLVETGYENVLLARLVMEQYLQASGSAPKLSAKDLGSKWGVSLRAALLHRYGVTAQDLVDLFGSVRDEWLAEDPDDWIEANPLYAGADFSLGCGNWDAYILTTKQTRFVETLLAARGISLARDKIFGLGSGPKTDVLARLSRLARERASQDEEAEREPVLHFVEDRVETLERVCADPRLQNVQLYFADWGFSTPAQRERALLNPRIRVIDLTDFACMCRALDPYKSSFECCRGSCQGARCAVEKFSFQATAPPPSKAAEEEEVEIERLLRTMAAGLEGVDVELERGMEEEEEEEELQLLGEEERELLELMVGVEEGEGGEGGGGGGGGGGESSTGGGGGSHGHGHGGSSKHQRGGE